MNVIETVAKIKSQLEEIELQQQANQQEQARINQSIIELEQELHQQNKRRNQLDQEALKLYTRAEELKPQISKLERIANLSKEFLELHTECKDNEDLLNTLYSSVSNTSVENKKPVVTDIYTDRPVSSAELSQSEFIADGQTSSQSTAAYDSNSAEYSISIDEIKQALPNAEKIYQQLVANYLEEYTTYQNYIVDGLDLIWYAVAFIAFGRPIYRRMGFKYHPDLDGSEMAMQLINTAWSISQNFSGDSIDLL